MNNIFVNGLPKNAMLFMKTVMGIGIFIRNN